MMRFRFIAVACVLLVTRLTVFGLERQAKRAAPVDVPPLVHNGVKYAAPHGAVMNRLGQNGGVIEARDEKTDTVLWRLKVYEAKRDPNKEQDVQDVFITALEIKDGKLHVTNERGEKFAVDLKEKTVTSLK